MMNATETACRNPPSPIDLAVILLPVGDLPGLVRIGRDYYDVTLPNGSADDMVLRKQSGASCQVSCWAESRGNYSCTCLDWQYRRTAAQRRCKHLQATWAIKRRLLAMV